MLSLNKNPNLLLSTSSASQLNISLPKLGFCLCIYYISLQSYSRSLIRAQTNVFNGYFRHARSASVVYKNIDKSIDSCRLSVYRFSTHMHIFWKQHLQNRKPQVTRGFINTPPTKTAADRCILRTVFTSDICKVCINRSIRKLFRPIYRQMDHALLVHWIIKAQLCQLSPGPVVSKGSQKNSPLQKYSEITWPFNLTSWEKTIVTVTTAAEA